MVEVEKNLSEYVGRPLRMLFRGRALALEAGSEPPDGYVVDEDCSEPFPGRMWLVAKQDETGEVYRVECGRATGWHCSCPGFASAERAADAEWERVRKVFPRLGRQTPRCKHVVALEWLLDHGHLDPAPLPAVDHPRGEELERMLDEMAARWAMS